MTPSKFTYVFVCALLTCNSSSLLTPFPPSFRPPDEFVQQPCVDHPVHCVWRLRAAAGGGGCVHRLLADHGGGHHPTAEPEHGGEDGAAFRPLESLLRCW